MANKEGTNIKNQKAAVIKKPRTIIEVLKNLKVLDTAQIQAATDSAQKSKNDIIDVLMDSKIITLEDLRRAFNHLYPLPFVRLKGEIEKIPLMIFLRINKNLALDYKMVPFGLDEDVLRVAVGDPNYKTLDREKYLEKISKEQGLVVETYVAPPADVSLFLQAYDKIPRNKEKEILEKIKVESEKRITPPPPPPTAFENKEAVAPPKTLFDVLTRSGILNHKQSARLTEQAVRTKKTPLETVRASRLVTSKDLARSVSILYNLPFIDLVDRSIQMQALTKFPVNVIKNNQVVVYDLIADNVLKVAAVDPEDKKVKDIINFLKAKGNIAIDISVTTPESIGWVVSQYEGKPKISAEVKPRSTMGSIRAYPLTPPAMLKPVELQGQPGETPVVTPVVSGEEVLLSGVGVESAMRAEELSKLLEEEITDVEQLDEIIKQLFVPKIVAALLSFAISKKASDIHIEPFEKIISVRYRIDGILRKITSYPLHIHPAVMSRIKILARLKIDETRLPQDGRFEVTFGKHTVDLRVSTFPTANGEKVVLRLLEKSEKILTLEEVGLAGRSLQRVNKALERPFGIILGTGPTGAGKSTTLYAILGRLNKPEVNIVTLEDPIEYHIKGVNQSQVRPEIEYTFANGLRSILRQDPNVIMVGEIRDRETADLAVQAALTGHLMLTTLHTNDASGAIPRLTDLGIEPFLLTSTIVAILAQRLVRKVCPNCKKPQLVTPEVINNIRKKLDILSEDVKKEINYDPNKITLFKGSGCAECGGEGYKGRLAIFEALTMSKGIEELAIKRSSADVIKDQALKDGMVTMEQDGLIKAFQGITTLDEVLRVTALSAEF